jgi:type II secretory pathway component PulK
MSAPNSKRSGMILVVVLIVVFMLSLSGLSFVVLMSIENKAVHLRGKELQAQCLLGSGEAAVMAYIQQSRDGTTPGNSATAATGIKSNQELFCGVMVTGDERTGRGGRFSVLSPRIEDGQIAGVRFGIENESARLNLGVLPDWERRRPGSAHDALMSLPGMAEPIADAILDWIDADDQPRRFGAESEYYRGINVPYLPRGAAPGCLEELLLVKGVSRNLLLGADVNCNYTIEPQEKRLADADGRPRHARPWASLLTVYSAERNLKPDGSPQIDINQKDLRKLSEELEETFEPSWARFIVLYRQFGPRDKNQGNETTGSNYQQPWTKPP